MMDVSRHKSVETLRGYVRDAELFRDHAGADCSKLHASIAAVWRFRAEPKFMFAPGFTIPR
jgi:hypothetical protein